ncbi:MAG: hypothetical protein LAO20_18060 [Acidobacteriia bacterium]|nr:hypothetical protein [Terriglobia bacterium]
MDAVTKVKAARTGLLLLFLWQSALPPCVSAGDLHAQSAAAVFARQFTSPDLSYIALDENGQVVAQRWPDADRMVPVGSLVKPFVAVAYGRTHASFPRFRCEGKKTCWLPRGHGNLGIAQAIAFSCNSYFRQLAANSAPDSAASTLERFGVSPANDGLSGSAAPLALVHAYLELASLGEERAVAPILSGMTMSAQKGTGKAVSAELPRTAALAKTGTAPCTHAKKAPGDGFAVVMAPAGHPRFVLLVRVHGRPGAAAADVAGRMIAAVDGDGASR